MRAALSASPWYRSTPDTAAIPPDVAERSLEWLMELQGDAVSPELIEAWTRWRAAHPHHEQAWQRIESVTGKLHCLSSPLHSAIAQAALAPPRSEQRRRVIKGLAASIFAGGAIWGITEDMPWREWTADYRTAVGERRTMMLPDGTQLVLNTDSAIDIRFGDKERRVQLIEGEILVTTAQDTRSAGRPFLVQTDQGTARALGTSYSVRLWGDRTEVGVFKGAVELRPRGNVGQALVLQAGYQAAYTEKSIAAPTKVDEASTAWRDGFIVARAMRLDDFVAELGRYSKQALSCDPSIAALRVSGSFPLADIGKVLEVLGATLDVQAETVTRFWGGKSVRMIPAAARATRNS
jgi:transmembrane sensor